MERLAALDIGSNTVHVLVGDAGAGGVVEIGHYVETTDLVAEVDRTGFIGSTKLREVLGALRTVLSRARVHGYHDIVAGATAAVRAAVDAAELLDRASTLAGGPIRVLDAEREARLTFLGVAGRHAARGHWLLADIGGGSTELMAATANTMHEWLSLEMGSSTYARRHLSDPPTLDERRSLRALIVRQLETLPSRPVDKLVVTGGTAS
ncbi:MAG TPA: hypothetical protein VLW53_17340, partial [Candidatus Eisenbacteria bacterium]|nr:hypothetical protein [Candidatus Eisenbacteria bacterium]